MSASSMNGDWFEPFRQAFTWLETSELLLVICRECEDQFQFAVGTEPARILLELDEHLSYKHHTKAPERG